MAITCSNTIAIYLVLHPTVACGFSASHKDWDSLTGTPIYFGGKICWVQTYVILSTLSGKIYVKVLMLGPCRNITPHMEVTFKKKGHPQSSSISLGCFIINNPFKKFKGYPGTPMTMESPIFAFRGKKTHVARLDPKKITPSGEPKSREASRSQLLGLLMSSNNSSYVGLGGVWRSLWWDHENSKSWGKEILELYNLYIFIASYIQ